MFPVLLEADRSVRGSEEAAGGRAGKNGKILRIARSLGFWTKTERAASKIW